MKSYAFLISSIMSIVKTYSIYPPAITKGRNSIIYTIYCRLLYGVSASHTPTSPPPPSPSRKYGYAATQYALPRNTYNTTT